MRWLRSGIVDLSILGKEKMKTEIISAFGHESELKELFREYTDMLVEADPKFKAYLDLQHYDDELKDLNKKYGPPEGRLYIAYCDGKPAGCIGLKRLNGTDCELKRLYVRPEFRGHHLSSRLIDIIISDARQIGYKRIRLDTLPPLKSAIHIYKKFGFYETPAYLDSPMEDSIYMCLDL